MMTDCLFCKIIAGQIQGRFVYEDHELVAIRDINPHALVGSMVRAAAAIAKEHGYGDGGYRTVFNTNREAGQTVLHIHLHLLAGRGLAWPPG
jgi:histidine triad (HIT) family protein